MIGPTRTVSVRRKTVFPGVWLTLVLAAALAVPVESGAQRTVRPGKNMNRNVVARPDGATFVTGFVESAGGGSVTVGGHRYDVAGAAFVLPNGKAGSAADLYRGGKVSLTIRNRQVVEVVLLDPTSLE